MKTLSLSDLRALVRSPTWRQLDRTEQAIRSIQQSLRVEGYSVARETVLAAIESSDQPPDVAG